MKTTEAENRFFQRTRGRIITLLRRSPRTVEELAAELELTDNAIRSHLVALERDGLVTQGEPRRGGGKPAFTYLLTPDAERLFPKAYGLLLQNLLQVLGERLPNNVMTGALREVGHRLAPHPGDRTIPLQQRVEAAVELLSDLGGLAEAEKTDDGYLIQGYSCPLATAVEGREDACLIAETLLADAIGAPVRQVCITAPSPHCQFEVAGDARSMQDAPLEEEGALMR